MINHGLLLASFLYNIRAEIIKSKLSLFVVILGIKPWSKSILKYLSFLDYFSTTIDYTSFGSIDTRSTYYSEKERMDHDFILKTLKRLANYLDKFESKASGDSSE